MKLVEFVKSLPADWVLAPIYRKGAVMHSGRKATGKNPLEVSFDKDLGPHDAALRLEKNPKLDACGLFTGLKGRGIVILDVDANLAALKRKWGESLNGAPVITSTRKGAAKFLFRVPEELWHEVAGFAHSDEHRDGYEVLWGRQGLVYGVYPGSKCGKYPAGEYSFEGDPNSVPEAPEWLLAEMRAAKVPSTWIKNRTALDLSDRTEDEVIAIIEDCLKVVTGRGANSRDFWVRIGMAIHSALPNEKGLELWSDWSQKDCDYADEWERGNPCEEPWNSFKPGRVGLGSLIWIADQVDPERRRFSETTRKNLETAEARVVQEFRTAVLSHAEVIKQAKEILELDNPSEINHRMNGLAIAAGYRERSAVEALLLSQLEYERKESMTSWKELTKKELGKTFLIPEVLPHPSVVLLYGAGGDGKSMTAWTLAKHVACGLPFVVRGKLMPVKQGPVLLLNGDQPECQIQEQLNEIDMPEDAPVFIQGNWQLKRFNEFCQLIDKVRPALVVIDSLIGCSSGDAFDENKSEFASPLYWLTKNNGVMFPATTIIVIHHANKTGGFRGTSAIRDGVDETWALKRPDGGINSLPANCRLINIEKSRAGRGGTSLLMQMEADLTFSVSDYMPEVDEAKTTPDGMVDRVLMRIRTIYPRTVTKQELVSDSLVGGKVEAIKKSLQRLEKRGLIVSVIEPGRYGKKTYQAVLARGDRGGECPPDNSPSAGTNPRGDKGGGNDGVSPLKTEGGQPSDEKGSCPPSNPSAGAESALGGQPDKYPPAGAGERTQEELNALLDQGQWD